MSQASNSGAFRPWAAPSWLWLSRSSGMKYQKALSIYPVFFCTRVETTIANWADR